MLRQALVAISVHAAILGAGMAKADGSAKLDILISHHAQVHGLPEALVRRVIKRESNYNPGAYSRGHWGLMQIKYQTARSMGYTGSPRGLLDAATNLTYGLRYLAGAYLVANGDAERAVRLYSRGYYYVAKRKGLLSQAGLD